MQVEITPVNNLSRSTALKLAAVISLILSVLGILISLPIVAQGAAVVNQIPGSPPYILELIFFVTGIVGAVAAYGAWKQMRWGILLTVFVNLVNVLGAVPGILVAPRPWGLIATAVTILLSVIVIVLCMWRERKLVTL
jgi:hypothetical protein